MSAKVVIGAAYGDEGKGATVNRLVDKSSLVVRFNGGAQAGHTVEHNDYRHVFSHIGAGTLKGASTYLSSYFVCSPLHFCQECDALLDRNIAIKIYVSNKCLITTPWDVLINQALEDKRGNKRHGSVGIGFNETIERCLHEEYKTTIQDIIDNTLEDKLNTVLNEWVIKRTSELDVKIESDWTSKGFADFCYVFLSYLNNIEDEKSFLDVQKDLVFEGAQGLMLDQNNMADFPHLTRSNCGLQNILSLIDRELEVYYVTRSYTTRHGAGPLPYELLTSPYLGIEDRTNLYDKYQGGLRFSYLNLDTLKMAIGKDLDKWSNNKCIIYGHMTCLDQITPLDTARVILNKELVDVKKEELYGLYCDTVGIKKCHI